MKPKPQRGTPPPPPLRPAPAASLWSRHSLILAALWALVLVANLNSFRAGFAYDNQAAIAQDTRLRAATPENIHALLTEDYWHDRPGGLYRPLVSLSYLFNYTILGNGTNPAGYHAVNLALHAINVALVYALALLLFERRFWAAAMAALWAVHPVLTESVTNIVGRADLLAGIGILGGLLCYLRSRRAEGIGRWRWAMGAALATAIGMFSKESAIVVVAAIAVYDLAFPPSGAGGQWPRRLPGYAAIAAACLAYLAVRGEVMGKLPPIVIPYVDNPIIGAGFLSGKMTAIHVLGKYLALLVWPARLACEYSFNQIPLFNGNLSSAEDWAAIVSLLACVALGTLGIVCYRRNRIVFFCVALFFCALAPTANIFLVTGTIMAERFLYVPAIAFAGLIVVALRAVCAKLTPAQSRKAAIAFVTAVCLAFAARTYARNFDWHDDEQLFRADVLASPNSHRAHSTLAYGLATQTPPKDLDLAVAEAARSIEILSSLPDDRNAAAPYATAGFTYRMKARSVSDPTERRRWVEKAVALLTTGVRVDRATAPAAIAAAARRGVHIGHYGWVPLYNELGRDYLELNQPQQAIEAFRAGRDIRPDAELFEGIAQGYKAMGDSDRAAIAMLEGVVMHIQAQHFVREAVDVYRETWPTGCAVEKVGDGFRLNVNCPLVRQHLCQASANAAALYNGAGQSQLAGQAAHDAIASLGCPAALFH